MREDVNALPVERVERRIMLVRGRKVLLDRDLAVLYGVTIKRLNEQVKRNPRRFPEDFMFQLTWDEARGLGSQFATLEKGRGRHRKYSPHAFTPRSTQAGSCWRKSERTNQAR